MDIQIEILNPKARGLLEELAKLNLIRISDSSSKSVKLSGLIDRLRTNSNAEISDIELLSEIDAIRSLRSSKK